MEDADNDRYDSGESGDYSRFGIPNTPKTTVTTVFGKVTSKNAPVILLYTEILKY
jgi:hypothetical protein